MSVVPVELEVFSFVPLLRLVFHRFRVMEFFCLATSLEFGVQWAG